jgi:hypothetical protein
MRTNLPQSHENIGEEPEIIGTNAIIKNYQKK